MKDWSGMKYSEIKKLGEPIDVLIGYYNWQKQDIHWGSFSHELCDATGHFNQVLKERTATDPIAISDKTYKKPNLLRQWFYFARYIASLKRHDYPWKTHFPERLPKSGLTQAPSSRTVGFSIFSTEQTQALLTYCRDQGVTMTSLMLWSINKTVIDNLLTHSTDTIWGAPVNLRQQLTDDRYEANCVAGMTLPMPKDPSIQVVHQVLQQALSDGRPWGGWMYSSVIKYIGLRAFRLLASRQKPVWIGVCSSLGVWPPKNIQDPFESPTSMFFSPPATSFMPVSVGITTWDSRLCLALQLHPSIAFDKATTQDTLNHWCDILTQQLTNSDVKQQGTVSGLSELTCPLS